MFKGEKYFKEVSNLLSNVCDFQLETTEDFHEIAIQDSGIWVRFDNSEITLGIDIHHKHYSFDHYNILLNDMVSLLFMPTLETKYYKGSLHFKTMIEITDLKGLKRHFSTFQTWLYPYWLKTKIQTSINAPILDDYDIIKEKIEKLLL